MTPSNSFVPFLFQLSLVFDFLHPLFLHLAFFLPSHVPIYISSQSLLSFIFFSLLFPAFVPTLLFCSFVLTPLPLATLHLSSVIPPPFLVPPFSPLSFSPPLSLPLSLSGPSLPLPSSHFIENVWYAGAFYTGMEPPPSLLGLMAGKEQPGRLPVRTFVSARGHAGMCVYGLQLATKRLERMYNPGPAIEKETSKTFPQRCVVKPHLFDSLISGL